MQDRVLVLGDNMLDVHTYCKCTRLSPEAPVPVGLFQSEENILGGAANVASQMAVATQCTLAYIRSNGRVHEDFVRLCSGKGIDLLWLDTATHYYLPQKRRLWFSGQQNSRIDIEIERPDIPDQDREEWLLAVIDHIARYDIRAVIFSDYNKGMLTDNAIQALADYCLSNDVLTILDPKRPTFPNLRSLSIVKPNDTEVKATGLSTEQISKKLGATFLIVTKGSKGIECYQGGKLLTTVQAHGVEVSDVCGAGDTVVSFITLALLKRRCELNEITIHEAMSTASFAASRTVQHRGSYVLNEDETKGVLSIR
jgi:D-beta-D-heptose 7-phosphate kinase/D-beta-D-heptose 1-phosphate adenosyltransferase